MPYLINANHYEPSSCPYCGKVFERRELPGRRALYCSRTCRQRAYETRRALGQHHLPLVPFRGVGQPDVFYKPPCYFGGTAEFNGIIHAILPGVVTVDGFRSLCGLVVDVDERKFEPKGSRRLCNTCKQLEKRYPPSTYLPSFRQILRLLETVKRAESDIRPAKAS